MEYLTLESCDATLRWTDIGSGAPIVILPGLSMPVLPGFAAVAADPVLTGRRRILIDCLGSGQSDHPGRFDYSLSSHASVIATLLDHLSCGPVDLLGHSMGGNVAISLAANRPDLVRCLVVAECNLFPGGGVMSSRIADEERMVFLRTGFSELLDDLQEKAKAGAGWADRLWAGWRIADPRGLHANAEALVDLDRGFYDLFRNLSIPTTFVYGEKSTRSEPTPDAPEPERLKTDGIRVAVVPGAGHAMMLDNHAGFMEVLASALGDYR